MLSRTTTSFVTFAHPFLVAGYTDELPPGSYELFAEDEVMQSLSFMAYRRTATHLLIRWPTGGAELRRIDHRDLEMALAQDQSCEKRHKNSEAALSPSKDQK
ncbi:hypothetical protein [Roseobacter weihaiensis]|uniref:hypothetical protein n=1 Tax=Roseobacter weihaiensis TaxID=2763262 RepID=UPI001D0A1201|nr:hypothetical protein [Roseobacter sp. H9]